ncbi:putative Zn finger protein [Streptacidiphilus sp. MAP12-16]|uniref:hypothetical protein n=1 Tax=Streptacidiphilus sp. MAP12-16 TaxID=3156300 RepID=UPI003515F6F8
MSELTVSAGSTGARVAGSGGRSYDVWVELAVFDPAQWARAEQALAADEDVREALFDGEVPPRLEGVLARSGLSLLPARATDLTLECSCPQWSPCGHLAAVLGALAAALDDDPFLLLAWRGRDRGRLLRHLGALRSAAEESRAEAEPAAASERPLAERLHDFWTEGDRHRSLLSGQERSQEPGTAEAATAPLGASGIVIRGRSLESLLQPAYEALID